MRRLMQGMRMHVQERPVPPNRRGLKVFVDQIGAQRADAKDDGAGHEEAEE
jgi:hypothetical protein